MKKSIIGAAVVASLLAGAVAMAQPAPQPPGAQGQGPQGQPGGPGGRMMRMSPEDRAAMVDARIAAMKAMLRLTPDQEKLWPPLEAALREASNQRFQRMQQWREMRAQREQADPVQRLRLAAERMAEGAATMKKIADAAQPLYASLDAAQKARVDRMMSRGRGMMMGGMMGGEGRGWGRGHGWGGGQGWGGGRGPAGDGPGDRGGRGGTWQ